MSDLASFPESDDPQESAQTAGTLYRCVCGELYPVDLGVGGICPACQRRVLGGALADSSAETMSVSLAAGDQAAEPLSSQEPGDDERIGQAYGHYRVMHKLGQGGMGAVYQALDESLQRYVALKVIHATEKSAADSKHIQRLLQEAIAQARVNHPNVVHIYFVGREGDSPFFAMEMVQGPTLEDRLEEGTLPFERVVAVGEQVIDALRHCARFDILHGDIKPSNILLVDLQTVKLSDFGLARRMSQVQENPALVAGTPNYLSPEAVEGVSLDIRSDMYSLGITLFEMTFDRLPYSFSGSSLLDYLQTHRTAEIEFPDPWPESVPHGWRDVLDRLLAKSPEDRYQNYDELYDAVRQLRPQSLPRAGRVQRGLAWLVDLGLAHAAQQLFYAPLVAADAEPIWSSYPLAHIIVAAAGGTVPLAAAYLQARWGTTPGKRLFQLRIVDRHGMSPQKPTLAARSAAQLLPIWATTAVHLFAALHIKPLGGLVSFLAGAALLVDVGFALFHRKGRSLHDVLFRTQVVLKGDAEDNE